MFLFHVSIIFAEYVVGIYLWLCSEIDLLQMCFCFLNQLMVPLAWLICTE